MLTDDNSNWTKFTAKAQKDSLLLYFQITQIELLWLSVYILAEDFTLQVSSFPINPTVFTKRKKKGIIRVHL